jgi:hypothetical protein
MAVFWDIASCDHVVFWLYRERGGRQFHTTVMTKVEFHHVMFAMIILALPSSFTNKVLYAFLPFHLSYISSPLQPPQFHYPANTE